MKKIHLIWSPILLLSLFSCNHEQPKSKTTPLTKEIKKEVANSKVENLTITIDELQQKINDNDGKLHIFIFDTQDCIDCKNILNHSRELQIEGMDFIINLVIMNDEKEKSSNTIEDYNVYHLKNEDDITKIIPEWSGKLPFILITNEETATNLSYQQTFSKDELFVVLQSLTM